MAKVYTAMAPGHQAVLAAVVSTSAGTGWVFLIPVRFIRRRTGSALTVMDKELTSMQDPPGKV